MSRGQGPEAQRSTDMQRLVEGHCSVFKLRRQLALKGGHKSQPMSVPVTCRQCSREIPAADVNVGEGVAFCRACSRLIRLADIVADAEFGEIDPERPPRGCRLVDDGDETVVRASARTIGGIAGLMFAAAFWNGILSVFVLVAIGGTLQFVSGSIPSWFPAPGFDSPSGGDMSLGMLIFLWIFLLPFIGVGLLLAGSFLTILLGRVEVRVRLDRGAVLTGFGPIVWRRRFDASKVKSVRRGETRWSQSNQTQPVIVIEADRTVRLGSNLPEKRREWMLVVLRHLLLERMGRELE